MNMRRGFKIIKIIFCFLLAFTPFFANAGIEPYSDMVVFTSDEKPVLGVTDGRYAEMINGNFNFVNAKVRNKISLRLDHAKMNPSNYALEVSVSGQYYTFNGSDFESNTISTKLKISNLNTELIDKSVFYFTGAHTINLQVDKVEFISGSGPVNLILSADIEVERYYNLDLNLVPTNINCTSKLENEGVLDMTWDDVEGAVEYELEWTFVNSYDGDGGELSENQIEINPRIFELNSTRVTTEINRYNIPFIFDKGYILYRVRAVGRNSINDYTYNLPAQWSSDPKKDNCQNLSCITQKFHTGDYSNSENLNWQYTVSFAESGKNKVVGSYFDGSLRNRQTVTKLNSDNKILVGETIYDHQGRGAITVLPVPDSENEKLEYKPSFNVINDPVEGVIRPYSKEDFDKNEDGSCINSPLPMDNSNGAANYYSESNPDLTNEQLYLPNANGFPFVQTEFMPDNTGRVKAQGGAGDLYQIGNNPYEHLTRYYYATPEQNNLEQLFGSEAGVASHFKKNMVKDPNGQLSISYVDMSGNVVATALSGKNPDNLNELSADNTITKESDLLNKDSNSPNLGHGNNLDLQKGKLIFSRSISATEPDVRSFNYAFTGANYVLTCEKTEQDNVGNDVTVAHSQEYAGVYDLSVKLLDNCGDNKLLDSENQEINIPIGTIQSAVDNSTELPKASYDNSSSQWVSSELEPGTYQLVKEITIDEEALETYFDEYVNSQESVCFMDLSYFIENEMINATFEGCITESECSELDNYLFSVNPDCDPCITEEQYAELMIQCDAISVGDGYKNKCEGTYYSLLADVSPMGQYGQIREMSSIVNGQVMNSEVSEIDPSLFPLSVFNSGNRLPVKNNSWHPNWRYPRNMEQSQNPNHYFDNEGNVDLIQLVKVDNNQYIPEVRRSDRVTSDDKTEPHNLKNVEDFIARWKPSWARSLAIYHPEYPHYELCQKLSESHEFDYDWINATYSEAVSQNYPLSNSSVDFLNFDPFFNGDVELITGSFFTEYFLKLSLRNAMSNAMLHYSQDDNGNYYTIWDAMWQTVYNPSGCNSNPMPTDISIGTEAEWNIFRYYYNGLKQEVVQKYITWYSIKNDFYNECIGEKHFDPFKNGFISEFFHGYFFGGFFSNIEQPCNCRRYKLYPEKTQRFSSVENVFTFTSTQFNACNTEANPDAETETDLSFEINKCFDQQQDLIDEMENIGDIALYKQCGICPLARDLQELIKAVLDQDNLLISHIIDCSYPQLVPDLKEALVTNANGEVNWTVSSSADRIDVQLGTQDLAIQIKELPDIYDISDIINICCMHSISNPSVIEFVENGNFVLNGVVVIDPADSEYDGYFPERTKEIRLEGAISMDIANCSFDPICTATDEAIQIQTLFNTLLYFDDFWSTYDVKLNYPQDEIPSSEKAFAYNSIFDFDMVNHFDQICEPDNVNKNWHYRFDNITSNVLTVYIEDLFEGIPFAQIEINLFINDPSFTFEDIEAFGNIKPFDGADYDFVIDVKVNDGTSIDYITLEGNIAYVDMGSCSESLPADFDPTQDNNSLAYSGYYECAPDSDAIALQNYLNNEFDWTTLGDIEYKLIEDYTPSNIEVWLPPYNGYYLSEIVGVSDISIDQNYISADGSSHYFTMLANIVSTDENDEEIELSMRLQGFAPEIKIGNCFPTANLDCATSQMALELLDELNILAQSNALTEEINIQLLENEGIVNLSGGSVDLMDVESLSHIYPINNNTFNVLAHLSDGNIVQIMGSCDFINVGNCYTTVSTNLVHNGDFEKVINYPGYPDYICGSVSSTCTPDPALLEELGFETELKYQRSWGSQTTFRIKTGRYGEFRDELDPHHNVMEIDGASYDYNGDGRTIDWMQTIQVLPNQNYTFSFSNSVPYRVSGWRDTGGKYDFGFINEQGVFVSLTEDGYMAEFEDGSKIGTEYGIFNVDVYSGINPSPRKWVKITKEFNSGNNREIKLVIYGKEFAPMGNDYYFDDISLVGAASVPGDPSEFESNTDFLCDAPTFVIDQEAFDNYVDNSPCFGGLINLVKSNAEAQYDIYLQDQRISFREEYIEAILNNAAEDFTMSYKEGEHQYTLYYYDQAGNLVRTVPPVGVNKITDQSTLNAIRNDRVNGTQTVFTDHSMVTSYKYNSLNQLLAQSMPDHDNLNIRNVSNSSTGIPADYEIVATEFVNSLNGFVITNDGVSGFIYQTTDGGKTWTEATVVGIKDLNAVQYASSDIIYAVGNQGMFIKYAGGVWNVIPIPTTSDLIQLYFEDDNIGMVFEKSGKFWSTSDGGSTWTGPMTRLSDLIDGNLTDIIFTESEYAVAITDDGEIYGTDDKGYTWENIANIKGTDLNNVNYSRGIGYASGDNGLIMKRELGGYWRKIPNSFNTNIKDIHFNLSEAVMIAGDNKLYYSKDGGGLWSSSPLAEGKEFADLYFLGSGGYAVTTDGEIYRTFRSLDFWNNYNMGHPSLIAHSLFFSLDRIGYVGGENNTLYKGTSPVEFSAPYTWEAVTTDATYSTNTIVDVYALSQDQLIVLYDNGILVLTEDGGASWNVIDFAITDPEIITNENILKMSFNALGTGLAIKQDGTTLKSSDGGLTWSLLDISYTTGEGDDEVTVKATGLNDVYMYNDFNASVVGNSGEIWTTTDGGAFWAYESVNITVPKLNSISITDPANFTLKEEGKVIVVGNAGTIISSENGGATWYIQDAEITENLNSVKFISDNEGVVVGDNGAILEYNTGVWTNKTGSASDDLFDVILPSSGNGTAVGKENIVLGGSSWSIENIPTSIEDLKAICYSPANSSLLQCVGTKGKIYSSTNGGDDWAIANRFSPGNMFDMHQVTDNTSYVVGVNGLVVKTNDKGQTWSDVSISGADDLLTVYFTSETTGAAAGLDGKVYYTVNGGQSWLQALSGLSQINKIQFVNSSIGVLVGNGIIYYTTGGVDGPWITANGPYSSYHFNSLHMLNRYFGVAVANNGGVFKTNDGGKNWLDFNVSEAGTADLSDVHFIDTKTGYIIGEGGLMLKTINGGDSWTIVSEMGGSQNYQAFDFTDNYNMVVVGDNGTVNKLYDFSDQYSSLYYYDKLGRLLVSQNAKQYNEGIAQGKYKYSFTVYDALGRIERVGEIMASTAVDELYIGEQMDHDLYMDWIENNTTQNITRSYYDTPLSGAVSQLFGNDGQTNLRSRVSSSTYCEGEETEIVPGENGEPDEEVIVYDVASHYSYDIHGNVKSLMQENRMMPEGQQAKRLDYEYDLISGNVTQVSYQAGEADQFYHRYEYDADNRITAAFTSRDDMDYDEDARYYYYDHGPLARIELGENKVQGIDYAYTLQGWLKGVNSNTMLAEHDMGKDGLDGSVNALIPQDEFGFTLGYNNNDYDPIGKGTTGFNAFQADISSSPVTNPKNNLYNGNIGHMVTAIKLFMQNGEAPQAFAYEYDQLNRITNANILANDAGVVSSNAWNTILDMASYALETTYDLNGNIKTLKRQSYEGAMDNLTYKYENIEDGYNTRNTNRLNYVADADGDKGMGDIDSQNPNNYTYDEIGNLVTDDQAHITSIEWTVSGKVKSITRDTDASHSLPDLEFAYDATGNRIMKLVKPRTAGVLSGEGSWKYIWYTRDAKGNIMATYERTGTAGPIYIADYSIYGSDRLGVLDINTDISSIDFNGTLVYSSGNKKYELKNHLGNVLATVSGYAKAENNDADAEVDFFTSNLLTAQNYYPFGMIMPNTLNLSGAYRFGFNGMEKDDEVSGMAGSHYTAEHWMYDARLGRRWNIDPVYKHHLSNYVAFGNNPIIYVDPLGNDWFVNHQGFYIWSLAPQVNGFEYAGTDLPEGVSAYKILTDQNGTLYHKNMSSPWIVGFNNVFDAKINPLKRYSPAEESFNEELMWTAVGAGALKVGGVAFKALRAAGGSIWKLPVIGPGARGFVYENMLGLKGLMKAPNFPVIDAFYKGVATSVKTMDVFAKKYVGNNTAVKKQLTKYIDDLSNFKGRTWGGDVVKNSDITERVLEVGINKGASKSVVSQIQEATKYAAEKGIELNVRVVK